MTGVDSIAVQMSAGYNVLNPMQWQLLSEAERFDLIKAKRVVFLCDGESVPVRDALQWLAKVDRRHL